MLVNIQHRICQFLMIGLTLLWGASVTGNEGSSPAAELASLLGKINTFSADFRQTSFDGAGSFVQEVQGSMMVQRPGKLYWHSEVPFEQLVVSDGYQLSVYDPDLEQVIVQALDLRLSQTPILLLSGEIESLETAFEVRFRPSEPGESLFELTPLQPDSLFEQLTLYFSGHDLTRMDLTDSLGQRSRITFQNIEVNLEIKPEQFIFEPPPGVDILRDQ